MISSEPVLVGVDGTVAALRATGWAAREAARRRVPLRLVLAEPGEQWVRDAAGIARSAAPQVRVEYAVHRGRARDVLAAASSGASLLVLGSRKRSGLRRIDVAMVAHARCPVVVVPASGDAVDHGPVVVGVSGSPVSADAVGFAFAAAAMREVPLAAVWAWQELAPFHGWGGPWPHDTADAVARQQRRRLHRELTGWREKYPHVEVAEFAVHANRPAAALLGAAGQAQLMVVGSHGRGSVAGLLLRSTSQALLAHARCPVAVVRVT
ncbi:universal stress protein [Saccharomonospora sp. NPDC046836]|uniref:universal stress protein n=1 Tax=Saccharomonospora sp. NPDC046836 TaxID=3156921 RepID=UPI0033D4B1A9